MKPKRGRPVNIGLIEPQTPAAKQAERIRRRLDMPLEAFALEVMGMSRSNYLRFRSGKIVPTALGLRLRNARRIAEEKRSNARVNKNR